MVGVSLGALVGLIIGTGERPLVELPMVITLVSPLESPNNGYVMPVTFLNAPLGLWFGYEVVRCWCSFLRLAD